MFLNGFFFLNFEVIIMYHEQHKSFLKQDFKGFVLSISSRQHFIFDVECSLVGVVILGDRTDGIGLESLKDLVWCHEYITRESTENLLDFPCDDDELWSDTWVNLEDLTAHNWLDLIEYK